MEVRVVGVNEFGSQFIDFELGALGHYWKKTS